MENLNSKQLEAVHAVEGPVLVLAGPGTGKTTLLTYRIRHILESTDISAENILCLTFTDSARQTLKNKLVELIGSDGYKVAIHTFHSFAGWIINNYNYYFDDYLLKQNIDELTKYQLVNGILETLNFNDPLSKKVQDEFIYTSDIIDSISLYKKGGFSPKTLKASISADSEALKKIDDLILDNLGDISRISKSSLANFENLLDSLSALNLDSDFISQLISSLSDAIDASKSDGAVDSKPLTRWKNLWTTKNEDLEIQTKYSAGLKKLMSLAQVWEIYETKLRSLGYYDFDDMILQVVHALQSHPSLLANIQENFYYTMVDEFQDTSTLQVGLLQTLMGNPANENRPNILIVGDDDQAIYGFQGAEYSNFSDFIKRYTDVLVVNLTENYRSSDKILDFARSVIIQNTDRLENSFESLSKKLTAQKSSKDVVKLIKTEHEANEYLEIVNTINRLRKSDKKLQDIAIIAPKHKHLEKIAKFLQYSEIDINYERRQNVLENHAIKEILTILKFIVSVNDKTSNNEVYLGEILSYGWVGIEPTVLYDSSLYCYKNRVSWIDFGLKNPQLKPVILWLLALAKKARNCTLEEILDLIVDTKGTGMQSFKEFYFNDDNFELQILTSLIIFRNNIRNMVAYGGSSIQDLLTQIHVRSSANIQLANDHPVITANDSVSLITAHSAKGREFDVVFIIHASQYVWVEEKSKTSKIVLPEHHKYILPDYNSWSEKHRLFYVASTRAKEELILTMSSTDENGRDNLLNEWAHSAINEKSLDQISADEIDKSKLAITEIESQSSLITKDSNLREYLEKALEDYELSPTHLNSYVDVVNSSMYEFLLNQLLKFPKSYSIDASFGSLAHSVVNDLHQNFNKNKKLPSIREIETKSHKNIDRLYLTNNEKRLLKQRLSLLIEKILASRGALFKNDVKQISELDFSGVGVTLSGTTRIKGILDRIDIDEKNKTIEIIDYKTGKGYNKWPSDKVDNFDAIKLHKYRQQLYFYYILLKNHPKYKDYSVNTGKLIFIESLVDNTDYSELSINFEAEEAKELEQLIKGVYHSIKDLKFLSQQPKYTKNLRGIKAFEQDLIS